MRDAANHPATTMPKASKAEARIHSRRVTVPALRGTARASIKSWRQNLRQRPVSRPYRSSLLVPILLAGCVSPQSTFSKAGAEAAAVDALFWIMVVGAAAIWFVVIGLSVFVTKVKSHAFSDRAGVRLILWGGVAFPVVVLASLLLYGLLLMPELRAPANGPRIAVSGERFWWRIAYDVEGTAGVAKALPPGGVESANELWLPVGKRSEILLGSPDVIHSFWVPALAGKTDAIPGRVNRLVLEPTRPGVYNGVCAEFCGEAHAQMGFRMVAVSQREYDEYVAAQRQPAAVTQGPGVDLFLRSGCGACHTVRGTAADGAVGPDLTHVASRRTIGAGIRPMNRENLAAFIRATDHVKPGVEMPSFGVLPQDEINAIATWLGDLR